LSAVITVAWINPSQRAIHAASTSAFWRGSTSTLHSISTPRTQSTALSFGRYLLCSTVITWRVGYACDLQAVFWPDSVATEMETNSALNLNAALT